MLSLANALAGIKVLDFSQGIAAPHAACLLGEMGAEVTKIEPPQGDWLRGIGVQRGDSSVLHAIFNRGKRGIALDLKRPEGCAAARRLVAAADVLVENNRPGVMARLGLDWATVCQLNPRLVYLSVTGYGQEGPYVDRPATDAAMQGYTGLSFGAGGADEPIRVRVPLVDVVSGVYASQAVLAALLQRGRTGEGQRLDVSLMHCMAALQGSKYAEYEASGGVLPKEVFAAVGIYRTSDGYIALSGMREQQILDLLALVEREDLLRDPRFAERTARFANQDALRALVGEQLARRSSTYWLSRLHARGLICQEVLDYGAFRRDPQVLAQQLFQPAELGEAGTLPTVRMPGLSPGAPSAAAPGIGEHTVEMLRAAGVAEEELQHWLRSGAVVTAYPH